MRSNWQTLGSTKVSVWALTLLVLGACSSVEDLGSVEQPFGVTSCATATASVTFSGGLPLLMGGGGGSSFPIGYQHTSPSSYNKCVKGYVVDINGLDNAHTGPASDGSAAHFSVSWGGPSGTGGTTNNPLITQAACENAWGSAIFYKKVGSSWSVQGSSLQANGTWTSGRCTPPSMSSQSVLTLVAGDSYRVVGTMRNVYGGSTLYPVTFSQDP